MLLMTAVAAFSSNSTTAMVAEAATAATREQRLRSHRGNCEQQQQQMYCTVTVVPEAAARVKSVVAQRRPTTPSEVETSRLEAIPEILPGKTAAAVAKGATGTAPASAQQVASPTAVPPPNSSSTCSMSRNSVA